MRSTHQARRLTTALAATAILAAPGLLTACGTAAPGVPRPQQQSEPGSISTAQPRARSAGHLDPASFSAVTVSVPRYGRPSQPRISRVIRSSAVIRRLVRLLNRLPSGKPLTASCAPVIVGYRLAFTDRTGQGPDTTVAVTSCQADLISAGGEAQSPLRDRSGAVAAAARRLLYQGH